MTPFVSCTEAGTKSLKKPKTPAILVLDLKKKNVFIKNFLLRKNLRKQRLGRLE